MSLNSFNYARSLISAWWLIIFITLHLEFCLIIEHICYDLILNLVKFHIRVILQVFKQNKAIWSSSTLFDEENQANYLNTLVTHGCILSCKALFQKNMAVFQFFRPVFSKLVYAQRCRFKNLKPNTPMKHHCVLWPC